MLETSRLTLIPATVELARAEMNDRAELGRFLGAAVPENWPPRILEDALPWLLGQLEAAPHLAGWFGWYAVAADAGSRVLVASVGFMGPPDQGVVEIGYSVLPQFQGRGYATEMVIELVSWALGHSEVEKVEAETEWSNPASVRVLRKAGFSCEGAGRTPGGSRFVRVRPVWPSNCGEPSLHGPEEARLEHREPSKPQLEAPRSWAEDYPDVPAPDRNLTVEMFVARWACGDIAADQTPAIAADLLELAYDSPGLRRLAAETGASVTPADCNDLMKRLVKESGLPFPFPWRRACLLVTRQIAREAIAGQRAALMAVGDIESVWNLDLSPAGGEIARLKHYTEDWFWDEERGQLRDPSPRDVLNALATIARMPDEECATGD